MRRLIGTVGVLAALVPSGSPAIAGDGECRQDAHDFENLPPRNDRTRGFGGGDLQALVEAACN